MGTCPYCGGESEVTRGIFIDPDTLDVLIDGKCLKLTKRERQLFSGIYSVVPRPARTPFLMDYIYGLESEMEEPGDTILKVFMSRLRKALKTTRFEIETVWGVGYRLRERDGKEYHEWKTRETIRPGFHDSI